MMMRNYYKTTPRGHTSLLMYFHNFSMTLSDVLNEFPNGCFFLANPVLHMVETQSNIIVQNCGMICFQLVLYKLMINVRKTPIFICLRSIVFTISRKYWKNTSFLSMNMMMMNLFTTDCPFDLSSDFSFTFPWHNETSS